MRLKHGSVVVAALLAAAGVFMLAASATAAPKVHCDVVPFSFDTVPVDVSTGPNGILAEWTSTHGGVQLQCANGIVSADVWEHAVISIAPDTGRIRGRVQIVIEFAGAGVVVPLRGTLRGMVTSSQPGPFGFEIDTLSLTSQGARGELEQSGQLDPQNETLDLEVEQGFFDVFDCFCEN
jgi:hypothetical protein